MKKALLLSMVLLLCAGSAACSGGAGVSLTSDTQKPAPTATVSARQYQIALVMKTLTNPFFVDMEKGARKAEAQFGISLIVKTGAQETSIAQQIQIVEELIRQHVDAIVIAPGSSVDLVKVLKQAQDAGIKIVNIDNRLDPQECEKQGLRGVPFISVKNDDGAYLSAKAIASQVSGPAKAVIIEGIRDADNAKQRLAGAKKAFAEYPNIQVVASESANWKIDEAHDLAARLFTATPDIKLVFCANDMMALGVAEYLKETNRKGVLVAGFDNLADAQQAIRDGLITATIDQQADEQGYLGVEMALNLIYGQTTGAETYVPVRLITKDTLQ